MGPRMPLSLPAKLPPAGTASENSAQAYSHNATAGRASRPPADSWMTRARSAVPGYAPAGGEEPCARPCQAAISSMMALAPTTQPAPALAHEDDRRDHRQLLSGPYRQVSAWFPATPATHTAHKWPYVAPGNSGLSPVKNSLLTMAQLLAADPSDDTTLLPVQRDVEAREVPASERPLLSITIPAVRHLSAAAPAPSLPSAPAPATPAAAPPAVAAPTVPLPSSRRSLARQSSRVNLQDEHGSPTKQPKNKGKEKAVMPDAGPSGPPPSFAVTGFTPPSLDASTIKALTPMIAQGFADSNDALARVVNDTTARQAELASQMEHMQAQHIALILEIRDEMRMASATRQGSPEAPQQYALLLSDVVLGHNAVVERVDTISDSLEQIRAAQEQLLALVNRLGSNATVAPAQTLATGGSNGAPVVRPLKRARPDDDWHQTTDTGVVQSQHHASTFAAAQPGPLAAAAAAAVHLPVAPAPLALAPAALPAPIHVPDAQAAHMPTAPPPMSAQAAASVGPAPGLSATIGPMKWAKDITGQVRSLIAIMPRGQTVARNVRATRAGSNFVYVTFQSAADAQHFVAMWNMARPAGYENVQATLN